MDRRRLPIAEPCSARFEAMEGGGARRFCARCETAVHDLSQLTRAEAAQLLAAHAGQHLCVRYRADAAGRLRFRPAVVARPALATIAGLGLAACTGWVETDELESPDQAIGIEDAAGYTIPADEASPSDAGASVDETPEPTTRRRPRSMTAEVPVDAEASEDAAVELMGDIAIDPELEAGAEGCPVPPPGATDDGRVEVLLGRVVPSELDLARMRRLERAQRRQERRNARRGR